METDLETEVREWLESKGSALWANWMTVSPDELEQASVWFANEMRSFWRHRMSTRGFVTNSQAYDVV